MCKVPKSDEEDDLKDGFDVGSEGTIESADNATNGSTYDGEESKSMDGDEA